MTTFALIHGGGGSAYDWHLVSAALQERGHDVVAIDLPTPDPAAGVSEYADAVADAVGGREDVVVVGHSFGGITAPLVCERVAARALVFVTGMVPLPGEAPMAWWQATGHVDVCPAIDWEDRESLLEVFFNGVPRELALACLAHGQAEEGDRHDEPSPLEKLPDLPTFFVLCTEDRFFPADWMRGVVRERLGIDAPDELAAGHAAPLSRPGELADRLEAYART